MKIGCILKLFVLLIIAIGIAYYIADKYSDDIIQFGKDRVDKFIEEKIENEFEEFKNKNLLDSLKFSIAEYFDEKNFDEIKNELPKLFDKIKEEIETNVTDSIDFNKLKTRIFDDD